MTPNDLIALALKQTGVVGVGQSPSAEDVNDSFTQLNMMLSQWNRRRFPVYHLLDVATPGTGVAAYTVGPAGAFVVARTDRIESAYVRYLSAPTNPDYQLVVLQSREDYSRITNKAIVGPPVYVWLDSDYPVGTAYFWPVPTSQYELHLLIKADLPAYLTLADDLNLPPEYAEAIMYNLAARLRPMYGLPPEPTVTAMARSSLNVIMNANAQIATLVMPRELRNRGGYNVYSDTYR